ncbi:endonuclease exonuclease phosphatase family protein [Colletotrichum truncatum]|uniref:Endonuclease exonuclease phosphatase family protein n=1 Tax=Colletotrichum truncatum TaxID=5467 RepID=A0ACC3Z6Z9_COLTU|nr:endonuclease exonuclease phosphatase family protein [Colletotrichum truncatum]KAF6785231.1 endonuclease exonuclease phosphatase family protein [Colletotrichum truncatum]
MELGDSKGKIPIRIITLNVRYAVKKTLVPNEQPWEIRLPKLVAQLRVHTAGQMNAFVCIQEAQYQQLRDIQDNLGPRWAHIGRGRADGQLDGEFSPIFYRTDHWTLEENQTYWLSPTPDIPSNGWGAQINRIVTIGLFRHKASSTKVVVMSTHLDHRSHEARSESAKLLLKLAQKWQADSSQNTGDIVHVFLGGDFNSGPGDEPHRLLTSEPGGMVDIKNLVPESHHCGNKITYTTFGEAEPTIIDHLFVLNPTAIDFVNFAVLSNRFDDGIYYSDHRPVLADIEIPVV